MTRSTFINLASLLFESDLQAGRSTRDGINSVRP